MGAIRKVNIYNVQSDEVEKITRKLKASNYIIVGTSLDAEKYINEEDINDKYVFVMGNEANGVSNELIEKCDSLVKIPMESIMESLNVATATTIVMYEQYIRGRK